MRINAMSQAVQTIGILTGGGDCPGLNAVIRAVVKAATSEHGWTVLGIPDGYDGLVFPNRVRPLTAQDISGILPRGGTILGTSNRGNPFAFPIEENGVVVPKNVFPQLLENCRKVGLDALILVGGDGTMKIGLEMFRRGSTWWVSRKRSTTIFPPPRSRSVSTPHCKPPPMPLTNCTAPP